MMVKSIYYIILFLFLTTMLVKPARTQETDPYKILGILKERTALVKSYSANIEITVDVDFIKMPVKHATLYFKQPDKISFKSTDFIMLPKRGFHNTVTKILDNPFIAMNAGNEKIGNRDQYVIKIIPSDKKSDIILATWWIDRETGNLTRNESNTRDQGAFVVDMKYSRPSDLLPAEIIISFEIEGLSVPLKLIGKSKGMSIDKQKMNGKKSGRVIIKFSGYRVNGTVDDAVFQSKEDSD
jgi:hypothetical protein